MLSAIALMRLLGEEMIKTHSKATPQNRNPQRRLKPPQYAEMAMDPTRAWEAIIGLRKPGRTKSSA